MLRTDLARLIETAVDALIAEGKLPEASRQEVEISDTKSADHGDFACNFALMATKRAGLPPRAIAELLRDQVLSAASPLIKSVDIAGPGFLNIFLNPAATAEYVDKVLESGTTFAHLTASHPLKINVEFVSVNPNGPITVGSGRGAAFGDTLCRVLIAAGNTVHREYYINDGVNSEQMRLFAESVRSYVQGLPFPEKGYKGDYVQDVAAVLASKDQNGDTAWFQSASQQIMLDKQRLDLETFRVNFDEWFSEQSLHNSGEVQKCLDALIKNGVADEEPFRTKVKFGKNGVVDEVVRETQTGDAVDDEELTPVPLSEGKEPTTPTTEGGSSGQPTLWLRSTKFGDDMDRVLRRRDGRLTYIASDVAYHKDKFNRPPNADKLITVLGPDHHGYIGRLTAVLAALLRDGEDTDVNNQTALTEAKKKLEVLIFQIVRFVKEGKPAPMRKRDGNIYALIDLINEIGQNIAPNATKDEQQQIGADVSRFFYLMRSHDTHMDFDIDLATKQSDENPVFYVQYAHARICSVLDKAAQAGFAVDSSESTAEISHPREVALIKKIVDLPHEIERAAKDYGVHRLATYAIELARTYHHFYDACRVVQPDQPELTRTRVKICAAARIGLQSVCQILGVSTPDRMERYAIEPAE